MAEGLVMQVAFSVCEQSANQMDSQREDVSNQISEYCKELLLRGAIEFSFEELRAERYQQQKKKEMTERLNHLIKVNAQMCQEVQEKERLLQLRKSEQPQVLTDTANAATTTTSSTSSSSSTDPSVAQVVHGASTSQSSDSARSPAAASLQINDESQSQPATATRPAGKGESSPRELLDDVFLCPDERGLCLKAHCSQPDHHGGTSEDLQSLVHSQPSFMPQQSVSKAPKELSPIQETSVEAASWTSLPGLSSGSCSLLEAEQKHRDQDHAPSPASENILLVAEPVGGAMDPCDPDVRRRLLEPCDVTSSPACHSDPRPLPAVRAAGGVVYLLFSRVHDGGSFSVYRGTSDEGQVLIKVDSCSLPWDFHQFNRLKKNCSTPDSLPLLSCFVFLDGCITVYTAPPGHRFTRVQTLVQLIALGRRPPLGDRFPPQDTWEAICF
uniref:uncharacterized protein LOC109974470 n=1 Tax=Monopterus albus TaxID=43700 RepID=UPI0009B30317|nr:uncharacterized protein LOC109974470 [Monopterus albus]